MAQREPASAFLFTDIEGSTVLWERDPAVMSASLAVHDGLLAAAVDDNGGETFSSMGDGIAAAFATCDDAVGAAIDAQRAFADHAWSEGCELRVRIGIHAGPAERRNDDYFGRTLNWTARIMSAGHGGQILISRTARDLVSDHRHGVVFRPEGEHRLKGISQPVELLSIAVDGLPSHFAPLRSLDETPNTIPVALNEIVGRDAELHQLLGLLVDRRLVTLVGPGGAGKTRLAVEAASSALGRHPGGVHVIELADLAESDAVLGAIAETVLGVDALAGAGSELERLLAATSQPTLVVLDNCEHLIAEVAQATGQLLAGSSHFRVMATSREPLSVAGEQVMPVAPLGTDADHAADSPAVQLFLQRARAAAPATGPLDLDKVAEICRRLDGLPLAIELAAARLSLLSLDELDQHLLDVLRPTRRRSADRGRHTTMDTAIEWSYALLDDDERLVLNRASVFVGTFDLQAASTVCGGDDYTPPDVLDILGCLADRSFVTPVFVESGNRYRLLELIRVFAADRLDAEETQRARDRHQNHYIRTTAVLGEALDAKPEPSVIAALELDDPNFVAALRHRESPGQLKAARKLAMQLHTYWEETGRLDEGLGHARALLDPPEEASRLWRAVLGLVVSYEAMTGRLLEEPAHEMTLAELITGQPDIAAMNAYMALGFTNLARGDMAEAGELFEIAAEVVGPFDRNTQRQALMVAGSCACYDDRPGDGLDCYRRAAEVPPPAQGWFDAYHDVFHRSALVQQDPGSADEHVASVAASLDHLVGLGLGFRVTVAVHQALLALERAERFDEFERWWPVALAQAKENGHRWATGLAIELSARSAARRGNHALAATRWGVSSAWFERAGYRLPPAHQPESDRLRVAVREQLGDEAFDAAWRAGAATDLGAYLSGDRLLLEATPGTT